MHLEDLKQWVGKTETLEDHVSLAPMAALAATLDRDDSAPVAGSTVTSSAMGALSGE